MIDFNRLTNNAQEILFSAQQLMSKFQNTQMEPEHIVLAMEEDKEGISKDYLNELKIDNPNFRDSLMSLINNRPTLSNPVPSQQLYLSNDTIKMFDLAKDNAEALKDSFISIEHILLAITELSNTQIKSLFDRYNITKDKILNAMKKIRGHNKVDSKDSEENYKALEKYSTNLTDLA